MGGGGGGSKSQISVLKNFPPVEHDLNLQVENM